MSDGKVDAGVTEPPPKGPSDQDGTNTTVNEEKPKGRRGSAGRPKVSQIMRHVQEGEALLKEMGHKEDGPEIEGRRRTRSSARGIPPPITPPPVKRERRSGSGANSADKKKPTPTTPSGKGRGRGRRKKSEIEAEQAAAANANNGDVEMNNADADADESAVDSKEDSKPEPTPPQSESKPEEEKVPEPTPEPAAPAVETPSSETAPAPVEDKVEEVKEIVKETEPKDEVKAPEPDPAKVEDTAVSSPVKESTAKTDEACESKADPAPAPAVSEEKPEEKEQKPVVPTLNANSTPEKKISTPSIDGASEVSSQNSDATTNNVTITKANSAPISENSTSPQKVD